MRSSGTGSGSASQKGSSWPRLAVPLSPADSADGPPLSYRAFVPPAGWHRRPLVLVHGAGRGATRQFRAFLPRRSHAASL